MADPTVDDLLAQARAMGLDRLDAQILLADRLQRGRTWLRAHGDAPVGAAQVEAVRLAFSRRREGVPVAYLTGRREFYGLMLRVTDAVLDPRPDTEVLVAWALACLEGPLADRARPVVADLGCGSGAIALALARHAPHARVIAVERSPAALAVARANGRTLGLAVDWREGDWLGPLQGERVDLIVANPPYIAATDPHLAALHAEPREALVGGDDGLLDLRAIAAAAPTHLTRGGWLLLEHGHDQADAVAASLAPPHWTGTTHRSDLAGHRRCTGAAFVG